MFSNKEPRCYKNPEKNHVEYHNLAALRAATAVNGPKMCPKIVPKSLENQLKSYINRFLYKLEHGLTQTEAGLQKPCVFTVFLGPAPLNLVANDTESDKVDMQYVVYISPYPLDVTLSPRECEHLPRCI